MVTAAPHACAAVGRAPKPNAAPTSTSAGMQAWMSDMLSAAV